MSDWRDWRDRNRERWLAYRRKWAIENPDKIREYDRRKRLKNPERYKAMDAIRSRRHRAKLGLKRYRDYRNGINRKLKMEFIAAYGGKCSCCGETEPDFLTVEHVNGRSKSEHTPAHFGVRLYRTLKNLGWPKDAYALLCMNCNFARGKFGSCPHEREKLQVVA